MSAFLRLLPTALATLAIALIVLAAAEPADAAEPIEVHFFNSQELRLDARLYRPADNARHPAIVLLHGCAGMFSNSNPAAGVQQLYSAWAERLVAAGYVVLTVDSFTPRGAEQYQCGNGDEGVSEVDDRPLDALAAHAFLKSRSFVYAQRIGLLGWSHGASSTLATIAQGPVRSFRAAIAFYPGCGLFNAFGGIGASTWAPLTPVRILHAAKDPLFTSGACQQRVQNAHLLTGVPVSLVAYPGAQHSFDAAFEVGGKWTAADVAARAKADTVVMNWFGKRLQP